MEDDSLLSAIHAYVCRGVLISGSISDKKGIFVGSGISLWKKVREETWKGLTWRTVPTKSLLMCAVVR